MQLHRHATLVFIMLVVLSGCGQSGNGGVFGVISQSDAEGEPNPDDPQPPAPVLDCENSTEEFPSEPRGCNRVEVDTNLGPESVVADDAGIVYTLDSDNDVVLRWSTVLGEELVAIAVGSNAKGIEYSPVNNSVYVGHLDGSIIHFDVTAASPFSDPFAQTVGETQRLLALGEFLLVHALDDRRLEGYVLDSNGIETDPDASVFYPGDVAHNEVTNQVYTVRQTRTSYFSWSQFDSDAGTVQTYTEAPYRGEYYMQGPVRVSRDGSSLALGAGDFYNSVSGEIEESLPILWTDALWNDDGSIITIRKSQGGGTRLEHWNDDLSLFSFVFFEGAPIRVVATDGQIVVVTDVEGVVSYYPYVATDDPDGDGVANDDDDFPHDIAASVDTDGDGYPDDWNPGLDEEDSVSGLELDAFPFDSACQRTRDSVSGEPRECDIDAAIPAEEPGDVVVDDDGVIYLLYPEHDRIHRYSTETGEYLNPIEVGPAPLNLTFSSSNTRLYLSYSDGRLTQVDPLAAQLQEEDFAVIPGPAHSLETAGPLVYFVDTQALITPHYHHGTLSADGELLYEGGKRIQSRTMEWNEASERMYSLSGSSSGAIYWLDVDTSTGVVAREASNPPDFIDDPAAPPIRASPDGGIVLLGSGFLYDGITVKNIGHLGTEIVDAVWLADGSLITIEPLGFDQTLIRQWGANLTLFVERIVNGDPIRVVNTPNGIYVIRLTDEELRVRPYVPTDDGDGDGVLNEFDAFPLDPAASSDSDGDGAPEAWNPGKRRSDSTTGLALDTFPDDPSCQTSEHSIEGVCDFRLVVPARDEAFCDEDRLPLPEQSSGRIVLSRTTDFIPFCDGWIVSAESNPDRVMFRNVVDGRLGSAYALPSSPNDLALDEDAKLLYVSLPVDDALGVLDLVTEELTIVELDLQIRSLTLDASGGLFILSGPSSHANFRYLPAGSNVPVGPWTLHADFIRYNSSNGELVVSAPGLRRLSRYSFDPATGPILIQQIEEVRGYQLVLSPDGQHVVVVALNGNVNTEDALHDFDPNDLTSVRGEWADAYRARGAAFDRQSNRLLVGSGFDFAIYDVESFQELHRSRVADCSLTQNLMAFSRGGKYAFGREFCDTNPNIDTISWLVP